MPTVDCKHCGATGSTTAKVCCIMKQGTVLQKEAVKIATDAKTENLEYVCCSCGGAGQIILKDPAPSP
jgi:hypothetical protein